MRNKLIAAFAITSVFASCVEEPPFINYEKSGKLLDSTYVESSVSTPQTKALLLEDVSGVKCVNCPDAAVVAKTITDAFPGRAYTVVMHPAISALSSFVDPIDKEGYKSKYDFRTEDAKNILSLVGVPGALPRGLINRRLFSGKTSRLIGREEWYTRADDELKTPTPVNIELKNEFNSAKNTGVLTVTLKYTQNVTDANFLTISLIEDSLVDVQEYQDPQTFEVKYNPQYTHMHLLRDVITSATGDPVTTLASALIPGRVFVKQYEYKMKVSDRINVKPEHARLLVFVHKDASKIDVLHVNEIKVTEN